MIFPVIEVFGPTIQGEGSMLGVKTFFVRLGGCDFRCTWCDSLYSVLPTEVKANKTMMDVDRIVRGLRECKNRSGSGADWVTLTGGNPAMFRSGNVLVARLQKAGYRVALETQGSIFWPWVDQCDLVTIAPKGPTSGQCQSWDEVKSFLHRLKNWTEICIKMVIFNEDDYQWARKIALRLHGGNLSDSLIDKRPVYFQVGTTPREHVSETLGRLKWLSERVCEDKTLTTVKVTPQMHVLSWGQERGR